MDEHELGQRNTRLGLALFVLALLIFGATIGVAYLYLGAWVRNGDRSAPDETVAR